MAEYVVQPIERCLLRKKGDILIKFHIAADIAIGHSEREMLEVLFERVQAAVRSCSYPFGESLPELVWRSEEHTSELQSLMRKSYAVFCLKKKNKPEQVLINKER